MGDIRTTQPMGDIRTTQPMGDIRDRRGQKLAKKKKQQNNEIRKPHNAQENEGADSNRHYLCRDS